MARDLALSVFLPTLVAEIGLGATLPLFALSVLSLGGTAATASAAVALYSVGRMAGSALGGAVASRRGPVFATFAGYGVLGVAALASAAAPHLAVLLVGVGLIGVGHGGVHVSRQAHVDALATPATRARALTTMAGVWRIGNFIGPLVGAVLIHAHGLAAGYALACGAVALAVVALALTAPRHLRVPHTERPRVTVREVLRPRLRVLATLGSGVVLLGALRQARVAVIPLWAAHVGLSDSATSLVFGMATAVDMAMFLPAGYVMDRWGRMWTAVPSAIVLSAGTMLLPATRGFTQVALVSLLIGWGHGWGSGLVMTLGADASPDVGRPVFLGYWSILQDVGGALGPAVLTAGVAIALPLGFFAVGALGIGATVVFARFVPHLPRPGSVSPPSG